jgi:RHS repeat-associated protein
MDSTRSQSYSYDNLNRVASGQDASHWGETYTYDNWSNLLQTQPMSGLSGNNFTVTANGNNQLSNLTYDSAGEVTQDQYANSFSYDAEGRILSGGSGTYVYDGSGNRVKKTVSGTTTLYWPGAGGLLDESNSTGSTMGKQVQFAGLLVWHEDTSGNGNFLFHDQLGSVRVTGSASGSLADDNDYQSFGELFHNYGAAPSDNHYLFTGDEADAETTSDYAMFRNLGTMGRFNRPDPYDGSYDPTNPQSLNRYAYVGNNPLTRVDPSGLDDEISVGGDSDLDINPSDLAAGGGGSPPDPCGNNNAPVPCTIVVTASPPTIDCTYLPDGCQGDCPECLIGSVPFSPGPGGGGGTGGGGGGAPSNTTPWYKSCTAQALFSGAGSIAIDSIGLIPEAEGFTKVFENEAGYQLARAVGNSAGYRGVVATQYGMKAVAQAKGGASLIAGAFGLGDTSVQGRISTGLTVVGFIPGLGTLAAGASIVNDAIKTGMAVANCH